MKKVIGKYKNEKVSVSHTSRSADINIFAINDEKWGDQKVLDYVDFDAVKNEILNEETGFLELKTESGNLLEIKSIDFDEICRWNK